jgi:hypothetical protein
MLTGRHRRLTVMAGEGPPSMPLFSHVKGVDADLRRHDEWGRPTDRYLRPLVLRFVIARSKATRQSPSACAHPKIAASLRPSQ